MCEYPLRVVGVESKPYNNNNKAIVGDIIPKKFNKLDTESI